jgi:hypothetical protein
MNNHHEAVIEAIERAAIASQDVLVAARDLSPTDIDERHLHMLRDTIRRLTEVMEGQR